MFLNKINFQSLCSSVSALPSPLLDMSVYKYYIVYIYYIRLEAMLNRTANVALSQLESSVKAQQDLLTTYLTRTLNTKVEIY